MLLHLRKQISRPYRMVTFLCCLTLVVLVLVLANTQSQAGQSKKITLPVINGAMQLVVPTTGTAFSYAILYIDDVGCCMANTTPLRFDLDTTGLTDSLHVFTVKYFDQSGLIATKILGTYQVKNNVSPNIPSREKFKVTTIPSANKPVKNIATNIRTVMKETGKNLIVYFEDQPIVFEIPPYISKGRSMAQLQTIIGKAGGEIVWHKKQGIANVQNHQITFSLNKDTAMLDGKSVILAHRLVEKKKNIFAPVTLWRDLLGGTVTYEQTTHRVQLYRLPEQAEMAKEL